MVSMVDNTGVGKLGFSCAVNTSEFQGQCIDNFVDTRYDIGNSHAMSARYIIEGIDKYGTPMRIYIENNGIDEFGDNTHVFTEPIIITDNPKWAWIETAPLHGTYSMADLGIYFWTVEGANQNQPVSESGSESSSSSDSESDSDSDSD